MNLCASPNYRKCRADRQKRKSMAGVAAREKKRLAAAAECGTWTTRRCEFEASFSPCGRYVGLRAINGQWHRCGSERAVRGALATALWNMRPKCT